MPTNEQRRQAARRKLERQLERRAERARKRRQLAVTASVVVVVLAVGAAVAIFAFTRGDDSSTTADVAASTTAAPAGLCTFASDGSTAAKPATAPTEVNPPTSGTVAETITTSVGVIPITLDRATGPCAVDSFISLTQQKYFDDTPCHRLTTSGIFVLQCGDPTGQGTGGPGYTINDEPPTNLAPAASEQSPTSVVYPRGTLAMAKTSAPNSGGSQFFLVYQDSPLPPDYTVFGTIAPEGLAVLDKVAAAGVQGGGADGAPATAVQLQTVAAAA